MDKSRSDELATLMEQIQLHTVGRNKVFNRSKKILAELKKTDETRANAEFLGNICVELDAEFGIGSTLCLEWMLDSYMGLEFERRVHPRFLEIYETLKSKGHNNRNKFDYFNDNVAFYIPHSKKRIVVFGSTYHDSSMYLAIDDTDGGGLFSKFYIRQIWKRTGYDCIGGVDKPTLKHYRDLKFDMKFSDGPLRIYGDCRDRGHIMTYQKSTLTGRGECDKVLWDTSTPLRCFFQIESLATQLEEE